MMRKRFIPLFLLCLFVYLPCFSVQLDKGKHTGPRPIEIADILSWKYLGSSALSPDGHWFAYGISSRTGHRELIIRKIKEEKKYRFPINVSGIVFSKDAKWVAFTIRPLRMEEERLRKQNKNIYYKVGLVNLATGRKVEFDKVKRFSFSGERATWLALHKYPPETQEKNKDKPKGSTLILYELAPSKELSIGNVSEFAFDKTGRWLVWVIDTWDQIGNGIQLRKMDTGEIVSLESDKAFYSKLSWTEKGDGLIALKAKDDENNEGKLCSIVGVKDFSTGYPQKITFQQSEDRNFPEGMTISPNRSPEWTDDLGGFLFGIHSIKKKKDKREKQANEKKTADKSKTESIQEMLEEQPDLVLWHWLDKRLQSQQQVEEKEDKDFNYLCVYWIGEKKFIRLADEDLKEVIPAPNERWAIGLDNREYEYMSTLNGRVFCDFYVVDMKTGSRRLALKKNEKFTRPRWHFNLSPDGTHFLYYQDGHFYTCEMESGKKYNITQEVPASFINTEINYNLVNPPIQPFGWVKDGQSVLLYDNWDVWNVPVHGGKGVNLTANGKKEAIRYRKRFQLDPDEKGIDISGSVYFEAFGEWTKKSGIARIDSGKPGAKIFFWDDALYSRFLKAERSDTYLYSRETFDDFDIYITDSSLRKGKRMTNITSQQKEFLWSSGSILVDYTSTKGDKLQAALFLPANYEKGKSYPTVVHIYERRSLWINRYLAPGIGAASKSFYTSQGYAVLMPDIENRVNDPVTSAAWCVLPAIEAAIATGVVDRERIGIHGHSMGGWETAFLITQTDIFKAAAAGAPLTDIISMYGSIYGRTGGYNGALFENSQGRIDKNYCEDLEPFVRNSPVLHAQRVKTPLLILHNDKDGAVDWNQGVEYFNILRRLQKPVVMLQYRGEDHSLRKFANQLDYCIRMKEFFDHHLKGKSAPRWLEEGIPYLEREERFRERVKKLLESGIR